MPTCLENNPVLKNTRSPGFKLFWETFLPRCDICSVVLGSLISNFDKYVMYTSPEQSIPLLDKPPFLYLTDFHSSYWECRVFSTVFGDDKSYLYSEVCPCFMLVDFCCAEQPTINKRGNIIIIFRIIFCLCIKFLFNLIYTDIIQ